MSIESKLYAKLYALESDPDYKSWLHNLRESKGEKPISNDGVFRKIAPGFYTRTTRGYFFATEQDSKLVLGITLASGEEWTKQTEQDFREQLLDLAEHTYILVNGSVQKIQIEPFELMHGPIVRIEHSSCHVGSCTIGLTANDKKIEFEIG